jgi:hypothetical protein
MDEKELQLINQTPAPDQAAIHENLKYFNSHEFSNDLTPKQIFKGAKQILFGLAVLYLLSLIDFAWHPLNGNELLDICKTTFPTIITLILAFYFGK